MKYTELLNFINGLKKEEFYQRFVIGVGASKLFSRFATEPEFTHEEEKNELRKMLIAAGIPAGLIKTDNEMLAASKIIMARAVKVR